MTRLSDQCDYVKQVLLMFIVAVAMNYLWEVAQAPLYVGLEDWRSVWWHCLVAAMGDGILIWVIFVVGWVMFKRFDWYVQSSNKNRLLIFVAGLCIGIGIEWVAINILRRWSYTANMPLLPKFNVGLVPVLQMLLLPPLIFHITGRLMRKGSMTIGRRQRADTDKSRHLHPRDGK